MLDRPPRLHSLLALVLALVAILFYTLGPAGCGGKEATESARDLPAGTVMVLDDRPITAAEVDIYVEALGAIMPSFTVTHRRRQALTNLVLPLIYGRVHNPEARKSARAEAEAWRRAFLAGELVAGPGEEKVGNWDVLGVGVWWVLRSLDEEAWSEVVELPGRFVVIQLLGRDHNKHGGREFFSAHVVEFPYVKYPGNLTQDCLEGKLEFVDPSWREIVPGLWKYSMAKGNE